jgi:hypothetical protein
MREVYDIRGTITEDQDKYFAFNYLLPEIKSVEIEFVLPRAFAVLDGNIVKKMLIGFDNETILEIEGVYLHKFFNTPPSSVSTKDETYIKNNPYTAHHSTEEMITLIRKAFLHLLEERSAKREIEKIKKLSFAYDGEGCEFTKELFPELDKEVEDEIISLLNERIKENSEQYNKLLSTFIQNALMKPKIKQDWVKDGDGLRNDFQEVEWGDISALTLSDFLFTLDSKRDDGVPYYTKYIERLKAYSVEYLKKELFKMTYQMMKNNPESLVKVIIHFEAVLNKTVNDGDKVAECLTSNPESNISLALFNYWWDNCSTKKLSELL